MKDTDDRIYEIEPNDTIRQFDCHVLSIAFEGGGGFMTAFPISDKEWRQSPRSLPTKVEVIYNCMTTTFEITDDWGNLYKVIIANKHHTAILSAIKSAKENNLYKEV